MAQYERLNVKRAITNISGDISRKLNLPFLKDTNTHKTETPPKPFEDRILTQAEFPGLPYDIKITDGGYTLKRQSEPSEKSDDHYFIADKGVRVYIIPTQKLSDFYASNNHPPEAVFQFLKQNDIGGRMLTCEKDSVTVDRETIPEWTLIIKRIDHETRNRWKVPDIARFSLKTKKFRGNNYPIALDTQIIERSNRVTNEDTFNLSRLTADVPLRLVEPFLTTLTPVEMESHRTRLKGEIEKSLSNDPDANSESDVLKKAQIKRNLVERRMDIALQEPDRNNLHKPNTNTLIFEPLRQEADTIPAYPVDLTFFTDPDTKQIKVKLKRTPTIYDTLHEHDITDPKFDWKVFSSFPPTISMDDLSNMSNGVNGVQIRTPLMGTGRLELFHGKASLEVSMLPEGETSSVVQFFYDAGTMHRRLALEMQLFRVNEEIKAIIRKGIEGGTVMHPQTQNAAIVYKYAEEQAKLAAEEAKKNNTNKNEPTDAEKMNLAKELAKKQRLEEGLGLIS